MAHAWIEDRWLRDTATPSEKRSLNSARTPSAAKVAANHRTAAFGTGSRWVVYWMEPIADGSLRRRNRRFASKEDAEAWRTEVDDDIRTSRYIDTDSAQHTVSQAAELWFSKRNGISAGTFRAQRLIYERRIKPRWGDTPLSSITPLSVEIWSSTLLSGTAQGRKQPLTAGSIQNVRNVFNQILDVGVQCRWAAENAGRKAHWPKLGKSSKRLVILSIKQVHGLVAACNRIAEHSGTTIAGDGTFIMFLACTGLRIGEAAALRVGDVNRSDWTVSVTKTRTTGRDGIIWSSEGATKNGIDRIIPIPRLLREPLTRLMEGQRRSDFLFRSNDGGMLDYIGWRRARWIPSIRAAKLDSIDRLTPHALRHTYASLLIAQGTDVKTVQRLMGHATATMTLDTYAALWPGNERTAIDRLDEAWSNT